MLLCPTLLLLPPPPSRWVSASAKTMVSWDDLSSGSSSDDDSVSSQLPRTVYCKEWNGVASDMRYVCQHKSSCEKFVAFESVDSGRRFLACAEKVGAVKW